MFHPLTYVAALVLWVALLFIPYPLFGRIGAIVAAILVILGSAAVIAIEVRRPMPIR